MLNMLVALSGIPSVEVPPGASKGLLELLVLLVGVGKWPMLALAVGAGVVAWNHKAGPEQSDIVQSVAIFIAIFAVTWFLLGLIFD